MSSSSSPLNNLHQQQQQQQQQADLPLTSRSQTRSSKSVPAQSSVTQSRANHLKRKKNALTRIKSSSVHAEVADKEDSDSDEYSSDEISEPAPDISHDIDTHSKSVSTISHNRRHRLRHGSTRHDKNGDHIHAKKKESTIEPDIHDNESRASSSSTSLPVATPGSSCSDQIQTRSSLRVKLQQTDPKKHSVVKSSSNTSNSSSSLFKKKKMKKSEHRVSHTTAISKATPSHNEEQTESINDDQNEEDAESKSSQNWLETFAKWSSKRQLSALDQLLESCSWQCIKHVHSYIEPKMQRDYISELPRELCLLMLTYVRPRDLYKLAQVSRYWYETANDPILWKNMCKANRVNVNPELSETDQMMMTMAAHGSSPRTSSAVIPSYTYLYTAFNPYKRAYYIDYNVAKNWCSRPIPPQTSLRAHDDHVITCLKFDGYRILSGSDDNTLKVWCARTGNLLHTLSGHTVSFKEKPLLK
jgi:hypothetical protein